MPTNPNKLSQFWQELKRRNVTHVLAVYIAAAFMLLELVDMISEPFGLPDWSMKAAFFILIAGLVIALIVSWIYDIHPKGGLVKTDPAEKAAEEAEQSSFKGWKIASYVSFIIIIALIILNIIPRAGQAIDDKLLDKSFAVLPFRNLSIDSTQAYFCDAIREEILNHLDKIEAFSVRSRTSTDQYRDTEKTITAIGEELHVNYLLEGSIGLEADEMKIWVQLIDAKTDERLWSDDFIYKKARIFAIQRDIAKAIAAELKVKLSPEEIEKIDKTPTEDNAAYQAYIRGRYYANQPHFIRENWERVLQNFQEAVKIDTGFALAYSELAVAHALFHYLNWDLSQSRLEKADQAAAKALELGSDIPEVHLALGYYYLYAYRDQKQQEEHWEIAERELPNNIEIMKAKASDFQSKGQWEESRKILEKASELNPNDAEVHSDMGMGLWFLHRYKDAEDALNRAITLSPNEQWPYVVKAYNIWSWKGPNQQSRDVIKYVGMENEWYLFSWYFQEIGEGKLEAAFQLLSDTSTVEGIKNKMWVIPKPLLSAILYKYLGDNELAQKYYETAVRFLEKKVRELPDDRRYHSSLGLAYAGTGNKELAIKETNRAVGLLPVSVDAVYGLPAAIDVAIVYTMLGEFDLAIDQLKYLLSFPNFISVVWIDWDIRFAPLKAHPRYKELTQYLSSNP
jgi:TolB-like protein/Tfp pilus assembly protein PilF